LSAEEIAEIQDQIEQLRVENSRLREISQALLEEADSQAATSQSSSRPHPANSRNKRPNDSGIDRRRVMLLRAQNVQLQRQIVALTEVLDHRHRTWTEIEINVAAALEACDQTVNR
jgi:hypothetical protein